MDDPRNAPLQHDDTLVLGPLLRYVDEDSATVWVEVDRSAAVAVTTAGRTTTTHTFAVHGHHYALVELEGLVPGSTDPYTVSVDGTQVWPDPDLDLPPSRIATLKPGKPLRLAFGSCRTSVDHDASGNAEHGVDALRALSLRMASDDGRRWPDLVAFLGDQVYADETTDAMREFIASRRSLDEPPGTELKDYEEYSHLYRLAWSDPANRWLLSTLPSLMIFDDHDVRDDWNTSAEWRADMAQTEWWHGRIVAGLGSYWVYQHLGNLDRARRDEDPLWCRIREAAARGEELDVTEEVDALAERADADPAAYRWSHAREVGGCRLVVVDSRAARDLRDGTRRMLDASTTAWLDEQMRGDCEHLLVATSLPFLMAEGVQNLEAWSEAIADGGWGRLGARLGEKLRRAGDLEHWGAFQDDFRRVFAMALEVADGKRGRAPGTVSFLSGDVHHSYLADVERDEGCPIVQVVCSPIRNPLSLKWRYVTALAAYGVAAPVGALASRSAKVPDPPYHWTLRDRPHYDNNIALLEVDDEGYGVVWESGVVEGDDHLHPVLRPVATARVNKRPSPAAPPSAAARPAAATGAPR